MANTLSNSGIVNGQAIFASQVNQIIDSLTGADDYDISISGSLTVTGQTSVTASNAISASYALTASYVQSSGTLDTGSFYISSSATNDTVTFTQGDGTTEQVTVNNVNNSVSSSYASTASFAPGIRVDGLNNLSTATNVKLLGINGANITQIDSETAVATIVSSSYATSASYVSVAENGIYSETAKIQYIGSGMIYFDALSVNGNTGLTTLTSVSVLSTLDAKGGAQITGSIFVKGDIVVSGSRVLTLVPTDPLPSGVSIGSFAVSASTPPRPYMWDGSSWYAL
jgi:hypothetical protein